MRAEGLMIVTESQKCASPGTQPKFFVQKPKVSNSVLHFECFSLGIIIIQPTTSKFLR